MKVVFYSESGNVESFAQQLNSEIIEINEGDEIIEGKYILIIPTTGVGEIPDYVMDFLDIEENKENCKCACVSGSMDWEDSYCGAAEQLMDHYGIETILKFENEGTDKDIEFVNKYLSNNK
jgi:ribonucleoside-diphosphate reductase protein NrdI